MIGKGVVVPGAFRLDGGGNGARLLSGGVGHEDGKVVAPILAGTSPGLQQRRTMSAVARSIRSPSA
jgi:hypothetical protein